MPYREDGGGVADEALMADTGFRRPDTTPCSLGRVFPTDRDTAECLWLSASSLGPLVMMSGSTSAS